MSDITYEPTREFWTPYEPWMRDVLAADARASVASSGTESRSTWDIYRRRTDSWAAGVDLRIHPDDVPERPTDRRRDPMNRYPEETLDPDKDNGTMPNNVEALREAVVGHRIASAERKTVRATDPKYGWEQTHHDALVLTLDDGRSVIVADEADCCAYTELEAFLTHPERVEHIITGVGTTDGYSRWHIYADMGDVLELAVGWSCGNPFYYAYGFNILVTDNPDTLLNTPTDRRRRS